MYVVYNSPSSLQTRGWTYWICIIRLISCAMQCTTITNGVSLNLSWVATLIYRPMNTTTPFDSKQINLLLIQLVVKHPYFIKDFIFNWVRLSTLHPLNTFSRFNNNNILLKPTITYVCTLHQYWLSIAITSSQLIIMYMAFCTSIMWCMLSTICQLVELDQCLWKMVFHL